jgi:hypothetical protein
VDQPVTVQLAPQVSYRIHGLKLIHHPHPLILIGSDICSGGRPQGQVNFTGIKLATDAQGVVRGALCFEKEGQDITEELVNVPTARGSHSAGTETIGWIAGPPMGGQCVRRNTE